MVAVKNDSINDDPAYLQFLSCPLIWRGYKDSMIRVDKIYSLSQLIVVKSLGEIKQETFARIVTVLNRLVTSDE
jgi:hypothetical protein